MILDEVAEESGFSSRTTFFRNFKALTGMTPQEWKKQK
jgi:AraC-like DNA-binding protein